LRSGNTLKKSFFIIIIFTTLIPPLYFLLSALGGVWSWPDLLPKTLSIRAVKFFTEEKALLLTSLFSSLLYSLSAVLLAFLVTFMPARWLSLNNFKGKEFLEGILLIPAMLPPVTFAIGTHYLFLKWNLTEHFAGVVLILTAYTYPYMLRALLSGYKAARKDYIICAGNLGAGTARILLTVELPLLLPSIIAGANIVFLAAFSDYFLVFLIGGGQVPSFLLSLFPLLNSSDRQIASFLNLVFLILPIVLFFITDSIILQSYRKKKMI
jgi:ABC-type spermidine/putrescine transport system permease subunit II